MSAVTKLQNVTSGSDRYRTLQMRPRDDAAAGEQHYFFIFPLSHQYKEFLANECMLIEKPWGCYQIINYSWDSL